MLQLWKATRPEGARLSIFSIEAHPLAREDAAAALGGWPLIGEAAQVLLAHWPGARRGFHRVDLPGFDATLDVAVMEAEAALQLWGGKADAWFLDGFSPALNPAMWRDEVLRLVAARSAPGARAATFTVAGAVRRGLQSAGFSVERLPGYGRKRQRLEARMPGPAPASLPAGPVLVIGGGIAGASVARALRALGAPVQLVDNDGPAASGNPAALVTPGLDASGNTRARLQAAAFVRAVQLYCDNPGSVIAQGAVRLETEARDARRLEAVSAQDFFEPGAMARLGPAEAACWLDEVEAPGGLAMQEALVIDPAVILAAWRGPDVVAGEVVALERGDGVWVARLADGGALEVRTVALAGGWGAAGLLPSLPLRPIRGQATWCALNETVRAASFGAYAIPTRDGVLFGATYDRDDTGCDLRDADHQRNRIALAAMRPRLAEKIDLAPVFGRAAVRATTADQMPLAGQVEDGLYVLTGLGSRGFSTAPLLAEHLAAQICDFPSPLPVDLWPLVDPLRL